MCITQGLRAHFSARLSQARSRLLLVFPLLALVILTVMTPANTASARPQAASLVFQWQINAHSAVTDQPAAVAGVVYWGSWDGWAHATRADGRELWDHFLGRTIDRACDPQAVGVASSPAVATVVIGGRATPVVYIGGGNAQVYALNAATGAVLWTRRMGPSPSTFIWSSPIVVNGSVYIGVSSFGDCPLVRGQLAKLNAVTGALQADLFTVPSGCVGGGIWNTPVYDASDNSIYVATGNANCLGYSEAIVKARASDLHVLSSWTPSAAERAGDNDFGASPTLFTRGTQPLVGAVNKNGIFYTLDRRNLAAGPVWKQRIAFGGDCPQCGNADIATAAWDGAKLYVASGATSMLDGLRCAGSVRALNPADGSVIWQHCFQNGPVLGRVNLLGGLIAVEEGHYVIVLTAANGATRDLVYNPHGGQFWGTPTLAPGVVYAGSLDGYLYSFRLV